MNVLEKVHNYLLSERRSWAPAVNYAYNCGFPCARNLVYHRLNWQEKALPSTEKLLIFREGDLHEKAVIQLLADAGIEIVETQRPFEIKQIQLRGKIDGQIRDEDGKLTPCEIKSMNPFDFEKINSIDDMKASTKVWIRGYVSQMMVYLLGMEKEAGLFIIKNKVNGELKFIPCAIDYEFAENDWKKLELVNKHVSENTLPERINDRTVCRWCDFKHICLPDEVSSGINISDDPELLDLLEKREAVSDIASEYEKLDKQVKEKYFKGKAEGDYLVGGKFQVKISTYDRAFYNVPKEIQEKYKESKSIQKVNITALK